jgi:hypothetical protein
MKFLLALAICVALTEIGARAITTTNPEPGVRMFGKVALLPYRPEAQAAYASWESAQRSTYLVPDRELGWSIKPNGRSGALTATAEGLRGAPGSAASASVPEGRIRVSVYGDSFTHGDGVALEDTWAGQLERLRTGVQVLNFGVPAYATDQALLRFRRDGRRFAAQVHILGIWPEDLVRNLSVARFYLAPGGNLSASKPRFVLGPGGALALVNSPVLARDEFLDSLLQRRVAPVLALDYWYHEDEQRFPLHYHLHSLRAALSVHNAYQRQQTRRRLYFEREGEALQLAAAIAAAFRDEAQALGASAYVALIPMRELLHEQASGAFPLAGLLRSRAIEVLDFAPAFAARAAEAGIGSLYLPDGHLTALGNRLIAEEVARQLAPHFERVALTTAPGSAR